MKFFYTRRKPQSCTLVKPSAHRWVNPRLSALGTTQLLFRCTGFTGLTELITNFDQLWFSRRCKLCCLLSKLWGTTEVALKIIHSVYTSYATLLSGVPWNIPRATCIFWCTHKPLGECVHQENTNDEWDIPRLYHENGLHNYFKHVPCHRKYSGQMGRLGVIQLNYTDRWEGSVENWRIFNGFPALWLAVFSMTWYKAVNLL